MKDNRFTEISDAELFAVNGGGIAGGVAGYVVGNYVGGVVGGVCYAVSRACGDSKRVAADVSIAAYSGTVAICTYVGFVCTPF